MLYESAQLPEEVPENNVIVTGKHCSCSRQLPEGHRIPWYTTGER